MDFLINITILISKKNPEVQSAHGLNFGLMGTQANCVSKAPVNSVSLVISTAS